MLIDWLLKNEQIKKWKKNQLQHPDQIPDVLAKPKEPCGTKVDSLSNARWFPTEKAIRTILSRANFTKGSSKNDYEETVRFVNELKKTHQFVHIRPLTPATENKQGKIGVPVFLYDLHTNCLLTFLFFPVIQLCNQLKPFIRLNFKMKCFHLRRAPGDSVATRLAALINATGSILTSSASIFRCYRRNYSIRVPFILHFVQGHHLKLSSCSFISLSIWYVFLF